MLKLVLQALSTQWDADVTQRVATPPSEDDGVGGVKRGVVETRGKLRRISITSAISCLHRGGRRETRACVKLCIPPHGVFQTLVHTIDEPGDDWVGS